MHRKLFSTIILLLMAYHVQSQTMSLQQAIGIALQQNYQVQIAKNEAEIAAKSNYSGAAGMLPTIGLNFSDSPSLTNINQEFATGQTIKRSGVISNTINGNIALSYTLFDGMKMFATKEKLNELEKLGSITSKSNIQNTISNVIQAYCNVVKEQSNTTLVKQTLKVSEDRLQIINVRIAAGLANNTDLYLAQLDLDTRKQALLNQEKQVGYARIALNSLLSVKPDSAYMVDTIISFNNDFDKKNLDTALEQNPEIQMANSREKIALQAEKEFEAAKYPVVRLNALYGFNQAQSQAGFNLLNQTIGPQGTIGIYIPLFTGGVNHNNVEIAKLQSKNAQLNKKQTQVNIRGAYEQTWLNYTTTKQQVQRDEESVKVAKQYLELMQLRYKAGQSTVLDFREAQRSFEETNARLINNKYGLKLAETDLLRITGQLVR